MPDLYITRATPNPAGKDRTPAHQVTNDKLNGEWLQFQNIAQKNLDITDVRLDHNTYNYYGQKTGEETVVTLKGVLSAGKSIRVHTGSRTEGWWEGDVYHFYAGKGNFVWNNKPGDTAYIRTGSNAMVDWASYDPNPGEGEVLDRVQGTNKLV
jgi:hypothetical protein